MAYPIRPSVRQTPTTDNALEGELVMDVAMVSGVTLLNYLRKRLLGDWVLVLGDSDCIARLEETIYMPGTPANRDFELIIAPTKDGFLAPIFMARKTRKLREFLELSDEEWKSLLIIEFLGVVGDKCMAQVIGPKQEHRSKAVETIIDKLSEKLRLV